MGVPPPPPGGGGEGTQVGGGGDIHNSDTIHGRVIYCDAADSGAVLGGGTTARR